MYDAPLHRSEAKRELQCETIHTAKYKYSKNNRQLTASNWSSRSIQFSHEPYEPSRLYQCDSISQEKKTCHIIHCTSKH